jgi:hypothetical protein
MMKRATLIASFFLLGLVIAAGALLVTTVMDQTVSSSADLLALSGVSLVATVPPVALAFDQSRRRPFGVRRRRAHRRGVG